MTLRSGLYKLSILHHLEKNRYHMISLICVILKKRATDVLIYKIGNRVTDVKINLWLPRGKGRRVKLEDWN